MMYEIGDIIGEGLGREWNMEMICDADGGNRDMYRIILEDSSELVVSENQRVYGKSLHISKEIGPNALLNSSIMHLFVVSNKGGVSELSACDEDRVKTRTCCFSSHFYTLLKNISLIEDFCHNNNHDSSLDTYTFASSKPRCNSSIFYYSGCGNSQLIFPFCNAVNYSCCNPVDSELLPEKLILFSSSGLEKAFNDCGSVKDISHSEYSLSRICFINLVESISDFTDEFSSSRILDTDGLPYFDVIDLNSLNSAAFSDIALRAISDQFNSGIDAISFFKSSGIANVSVGILYPPLAVNASNYVYYVQIYKSFDSEVESLELEDEGAEYVDEGRKDMDRMIGRVVGRSIIIDEEKVVISGEINGRGFGNGGSIVMEYDGGGFGNIRGLGNGNKVCGVTGIGDGLGNGNKVAFGEGLLIWDDEFNGEEGWERGILEYTERLGNVIK